MGSPLQLVMRYFRCWLSDEDEVFAPHEQEEVIKEPCCPSLVTYPVRGVEGINKSVCVIRGFRSRVENPNDDHKNQKDHFTWKFFLVEGFGSSLEEATTPTLPCDVEGIITHPKSGFFSMLHPFMEAKMDFMDSSFVVTQGHNRTPMIYCLSGYPMDVPGGSENSRDVHILSLVDCTWTRGPSMCSARVSPVVLAVEGIIFAFGGVRPSGSTIYKWGEYLDTNNSESNWEYLPPPPKYLGRGLFAVVVDVGGVDSDGVSSSMGEENSKTILVGAAYDRAFFLYNIKGKEWHSIPERISRGEFGNSIPVAVGHVLYWVNNCANAYDLGRGKWFFGSIRGLNNYLQQFLHGKFDFPYSCKLHHLGGDDFCFTWFENSSPVSLYKLHSTIIRIKILCYCSPTKLDAYVVSSRSYPLPQEHGFFVYERSLLLDGFGCGLKGKEEFTRASVAL